MTGAKIIKGLKEAIEITMTQEPLEEELIERVARIISVELNLGEDKYWESYKETARFQILSYRAIAAYDTDAKHVDDGKSDDASR